MRKRAFQNDGNSQTQALKEKWNLWDKNKPLGGKGKVKWVLLCNTEEYGVLDATTLLCPLNVVLWTGVVRPLLAKISWNDNAGGGNIFRRITALTLEFRYYVLTTLTFVIETQQESETHRSRISRLPRLASIQKSYIITVVTFRRWLTFTKCKLKLRKCMQYGPQ